MTKIDWHVVPKLDFDRWFKKPLPDMPKDAQKILVTCIEARTGMRYVSIDECCVDEIDGFHYELCEAWRRWGEDVIAWAELPEPYEGDKE